MKLRNRTAIFFVALLGWAAAINAIALCQESPPRAIVLAWDGTVPAFVNAMLRDGKLPNLAKLIESGAFADEVIPVFPSLTAPGFASISTGAPPNRTGITGNRIPRGPHAEFTILESTVAFNPALLRAESIWSVAARAGRRVVTAHFPFANESSQFGVHLQGYAGIAGRDGIVTARTAKPGRATSWENLPPSRLPQLEIAFNIAGSSFFGLLIDDPVEPGERYNTLLITNARNGKDILTRLKSTPAGPLRESAWSAPVSVRTTSGHSATTYLRLFDIKADGSDFLLYFTRPAREVISAPEQLKNAGAMIRAFIGNGASQLYSQGALGTTIPNGGDGTAESRYLETVYFAQNQLMETLRWMLDSLAWELLAAYTPFPDEAEHLWRGYLDSTLPGFRRDIATRLHPYLERVYQTSDGLLGTVLAYRPDNTIIALVSDHGMEGVNKLVAINNVLHQSGLLAFDGYGRIDLAKTQAVYPATHNGSILINTTDRKHGIVVPEHRNEVARRVRDALSRVRDGTREVVTAIFDSATDGPRLGIGGYYGGDLYIDLLPGYDFDASLRSFTTITRRSPHGMHGFNPQRPSMRTLMVFNGPGVTAGRKLRDVRLIDFAPTLAKLLNLPPLENATGKILEEAVSELR